MRMFYQVNFEDWSRNCPRPMFPQTIKHMVESEGQKQKSEIIYYWLEIKSDVNIFPF